MHTLIDVRDLAPGLREESWRTMLHDLFGLDVEVGHDLPTGFHNRLKGHEFGALMLTEIEGHAQYTKVVPEPATAQRDGILAWVALQGSGTLLQDDQRVQVAPGLLTICSGNRPRTAVRTSAFHHIVLNVPRRALVPHLRGHELRIPCSLDAVAGPGALLCDFVTALVTHGGDVAAGPRAALEDVLLRLLATALLHAPEARPSAGGTESVQRARIREFVVQHLRDPGLSVDSISRAVALSPRYVHQLFASEPQPVMRWIWSMRLDGARADLRASTPRSIGQIAADWGFIDAAHFSRAFKKLRRDPRACSPERPPCRRAGHGLSRTDAASSRDTFKASSRADPLARLARRSRLPFTAWSAGVTSSLDFDTPRFSPPVASAHIA
jgi:AraC-like DNA-binding protein